MVVIVIVVMVVVIVVMMIVIGTLAFNFQVLLPLLGRFTFDGGAGAYTALAVAMAVGSVAGALTTGARGRVTEKVVDDSDRELPTGQPGRLLLRACSNFGGYLHRPQWNNTDAEGWFDTGDLAYVNADGYIRITGRSKDVIISGGENIASVEVEQVLADHPAVLEAAVVAAPDEKWGEVPVAFVTLHEGANATAEELQEHVRARLARFKAPKQVVFGPLPKTSTGKIQKYVLRQRTAASRR